ncbi:RNA polymerase sigma-70 factor (family 1) [Pedobacter africanus]|uniref:RNA polymerase sigma-70 factor (ECF subfamily) n=1 Tax=Pedobacter africanus TaxID=151894 RepID=A0ACC6KVZ4_9SPHI|nr:sigma-70 family RNA polymerase sigma factor [Pedobacter africanus]MDR6783335.1 RNA polymerase sigma-70 factor (ECF subfamily) [Pedobacter africanus]
MREYSSHSDQELICLLKDGNQRAFKMLYDRYWEKLIHYAAHKTGDLMEGENAVQEVFVSLWNRREQLDITTDLSRYLTVSVKYRVIKILNKQRTQRIHEQTSLESCDLLDDSTQQYLDLEELRNWLEENICKLPEQSALIFRMSKEQGLSHKEISEKTGLSEKAVNSHLVRSKKTLLTNLRSFLNAYLL